MSTKDTASFDPNPSDQLTPTSVALNWPEASTAILVGHGTGNQLPRETLEQFGRGFISAYQKEFGDSLVVSHHLVDKEDSRSGVWFDNVLRLSRKNHPGFIDLYEYYWAYYPEDKATWRDSNSWIQGVVKGAKYFYKRNTSLDQQYEGKSTFFDSETGRFNSFRTHCNYYYWTHQPFYHDIINHLVYSSSTMFVFNSSNAGFCLAISEQSLLTNSRKPQTLAPLT